jgi:hypothetical protein
MTTTNLDAMIRDAMDNGITHHLIPRETADRMRARLEELTGSKTAGHEPDGGKYRGHAYRMHTVEIQRGHH